MSHRLFNIVITLGLRHTGLITLHSSVFVQVKFQKEQRALRMHLEDSTMEEALWALGQVNGPCSLSLRTKQDGEHVSFHLLKQILLLRDIIFWSFEIKKQTQRAYQSEEV